MISPTVPNATDINFGIAVRQLTGTVERGEEKRICACAAIGALPSPGRYRLRRATRNLVAGVFQPPVSAAMSAWPR